MKPDFAAVDEVVHQLEHAAAAKKCWPCGCLHGSLQAIERALPEGDRPAGLNAAMQAGKDKLEPVKYDCLGCEVCYPAIALNAMSRSGLAYVEYEHCPTEPAA